MSKGCLRFVVVTNEKWPPVGLNIEASFEAKWDIHVGTGVEAGSFSQSFPHFKADD